jgi:hypothetical protein
MNLACFLIDNGDSASGMIDKHLFTGTVFLTEYDIHFADPTAVILVELGEGVPESMRVSDLYAGVLHSGEASISASPGTLQFAQFKLIT